MSHQRPLPAFLEGRLLPSVYERWLARKAAAHVKRDRKRGYQGVTGAVYRATIHEPVVCSEGRDVYTGEGLAWHLISKYSNDESESGRHQYKAGFAMLPTVDHIDSSLSNSGFCICAWRTNDAKNDLSHQAFIDLCLKVLQHAGYTIDKEA